MTIDLDKSQPPAAHDFATFLTRLPKAELHVHVVGAIRPTTLAELAAHRGVVLPRSIETLYQYRNFYDFIELFGWRPAVSSPPATSPRRLRIHRDRSPCQQLAACRVLLQPQLPLSAA